MTVTASAHTHLARDSSATVLTNWNSTCTRLSATICWPMRWPNRFIASRAARRAGHDETDGATGGPSLLRLCGGRQQGETQQKAAVEVFGLAADIESANRGGKRGLCDVPTKADREGTRGNQPAMCDVPGWLKKFGMMGPSTNTVEQPDFDMMRPPGVTAHDSRIFTPDSDAVSNESFRAGAELISKNTLDAVCSVLICKPDYLVMGMSAVTFLDGMVGADRSTRSVEEEAGLKVSLGSHSCHAAL